MSGETLRLDWHWHEATDTRQANALDGQVLVVTNLTQLVVYFWTIRRSHDGDETAWGQAASEEAARAGAERAWWGGLSAHRRLAIQAEMRRAAQSL